MGRPSKAPGGVRQGKPGVAYSAVRGDLNTPPAFKGQVQGTGVAQQAVAGATQQGAQAAQPQPLEQMGGGGPLLPPGTPMPGSFPSITAPTERPGEPVTHGMPFGAGPNALPQPFRPDPMATTQAFLARLPASQITPQLAALRDASNASVNNATSPAVEQTPTGPPGGAL